MVSFFSLMVTDLKSYKYRGFFFFLQLQCFKGDDGWRIRVVFLPPKCTCSSPNWPTVSVRVAIKINGYNCGSLSPRPPLHTGPSLYPFSWPPSLPGCGQSASWWRRNGPGPTHLSSAACSGPLSSSAPSTWRPLRRGKHRAHDTIRYLETRREAKKKPKTIMNQRIYPLFKQFTEVLSS